MGLGLEYRHNKTQVSGFQLVWDFMHKSLASFEEITVDNFNFIIIDKLSTN